MSSPLPPRSPNRRVSLFPIIVGGFVTAVLVGLGVLVALVVTGTIKPPAAGTPTSEAAGGGGGMGTPPPPPKPPETPPPTTRTPPRYAKVTPVEITPAKLDGGPQEVPLPGAVADACVGGGGRFLILHLGAKRQLAVFDASQAKVVKLIDLPGANVKVAAGMNAVIVADVDKSLFTRYSLATFEREVSGNTLVSGTIRRLAMGSASAGPLLVGMNTDNTPGGGELHFVDPEAFAVLAIDQKGGKPIPAGDDKTRYRVRPDGKAFSAWNSAASPPELRLVTVNGRNAEVFAAPLKVRHAVPGPGDSLATDDGLFTRELKPTGGVEKGQFVPAAEGSLSLRIRGGELGGWDAEVVAADNGSPKFTFKGVVPPPPADAGDLTLDKRVHFVPAARLLVIIPPSNDKLMLYPYQP